MRCANGTSAYLDELEIEANRAPAAAVPAAVAAIPPPLPQVLRLSDAQAIGACEAKVRNGLPKPASLARSLQSTGIERAPGGDPVVRFEFSALNGFGYPLALQAQCTFDDAKLARLHVTAR